MTGISDATLANAGPCTSLRHKQTCDLHCIHAAGSLADALQSLGAALQDEPLRGRLAQGRSWGKSGRFVLLAAADAGLAVRLCCAALFRPDVLPGTFSVFPPDIPHGWA